MFHMARTVNGRDGALSCTWDAGTLAGIYARGVISRCVKKIQSDATLSSIINTPQHERNARIFSRCNAPREIVMFATEKA